MKVIIFGATGMIGAGTLLEALAEPQVAAVLAVGRRPCGVIHAKLEEVLHADFYDYSALQSRWTGYDACLFCLGVTSAGMDEASYRRLTYDLTLAAAGSMAAVNPGMVFCYVSGAGTDSTGRGRMMWARVKGETENALLRCRSRRPTCSGPATSSRSRACGRAPAGIRRCTTSWDRSIPCCAVLRREP
jgi:uncharacterized protein YbjT (DUF2867 family)